VRSLRRSADELRVGLNLVYLMASSGGSGTYARELIPALLATNPRPRVTAFVSASVPEPLFREPWAGEVDWVRFPVAATGSPPWHLLAQMAAIPSIARHRRLDVVHGLANLIPPVSLGVPTVVTLLDVTWIHYPQTMERRATLGMKVLAPLCARAATRVIAISHAAKEDIAQTIGLDLDKIDVTPLGVSLENGAPALPAEVMRERLGLGPGPIALCVAQKRVHKNLERLVRAVAASTLSELQLVLPGAPTPHEDELGALAAELGIAEQVFFPGWLEDEELEGLYAAASCFVLPSLSEGFGLPILEAMRRGLPVACSNVSSLPEVAGDAALLFPPEDVPAIADAIRRLVTDEDLARELVLRGYERCRIFMWEKTAEATLASYRRAIESRRGVGLKRR
jgi:glycosyltransferase involved in cell wall biosynthesis